MSRIAFIIVLITLMAIPCASVAGSIDVKIKGIDDGVKTSRQQDFKEAVLFAKREAIERAGVKIRALTTVEMLVINSDYIESKAEAVLLPGYDILDMGYSAEGTYQVVLIGKVQIAPAESKEVSEEGIDSKELRYAKSLADRGQIVAAEKIISAIIQNSKDDNAVAEAMYLRVLWGSAPDDVIDTFEKLKAYYPNSKYITRLEPIAAKIRKNRKVVGRDGHFIALANGVVQDTKTGYEWFAGPDKNTDWKEANSWVQSLSADGWRLPTAAELRTLYKKNTATHNIITLINTTGWKVWTGETEDSSSMVVEFNFYEGKKRWTGPRSLTHFRCFAIRSRQ